MMANVFARLLVSLAAAFWSASCPSDAIPEKAETVQSQPSSPLWSPDNLFAWGAIASDSIKRSPEERAKMLADLGFTQLAFDWNGQYVADFEAQIQALKRHSIKIIGWTLFEVYPSPKPIDWKSYEVRDLGNLMSGHEHAKALTLGDLLEMFKRHQISPALWVIRAGANPPSLTKSFDEMNDEEKNQAFQQFLRYDLTSTPKQHVERVAQEAAHYKPLAELAASYGLKVGLYKHGGWIGITDNQVAVIERLKTNGVNNVGIVYQFIHVHDEVDETADFPAVWSKVKPHALALNITGVHAGRVAIYPILYPSQGDLEFDMMRTVQESGWQGPVGLSPEKGGDAAVNLKNNLIGLKWLSAELALPGSAGPKPLGAVSN